MAFQFVSQDYKKSFTISASEVKTIEDLFAKGYSNASLLSLANDPSSSGNFFDVFFAEHDASQVLICKIALLSLAIFYPNEKETLEKALIELEPYKEDVLGTYNLIKDALDRLKESDVALYISDVVAMH